jgi:hypothetical protein
VSFLLLAGCAAQIRQEDLYGTWQLNERSRRLLTLRTRSLLTLKVDGSFVAENLPCTAFSDGHPWQRTYFGVGRWSVPPSHRTEGFVAMPLEFSDRVANGPTGLIFQVDKDSRGPYFFAWLSEEGGDRLEFRRQ